MTIVIFVAHEGTETRIEAKARESIMQAAVSHG